MKIRTVDITRMASPSEVIFDALRLAITDGSLSEGEVLRQDHIAKMFNVSRIPVREALTRLEEQGLVTTQRYRGAVVASLSFAEIKEIFEFRALVEPEAVRYACANMSEESLALAAARTREFGVVGDPTKWGEINREFHYALYRDCGRAYYLQIINAALNRIERYQRLQLTLTEGMERACAEHQAILDACIARDGDRAAELTRTHILGACNSLIDILAETRRHAPERQA